MLAGLSLGHWLGGLYAAGPNARRWTAALLAAACEGYMSGDNRQGQLGTGSFDALNGVATVDFTVHGLAAGQEVMFNVLAVFPAPVGWNPAGIGLQARNVRSPVSGPRRSGVSYRFRRVRTRIWCQQ